MTALLECFPKHNNVVADSVYIVAFPVDVFVDIRMSQRTFILTSTEDVLTVDTGWQHVVLLMTLDVVANK